MKKEAEYKDLGKDLAALIENLPLEERRRYQRKIALFVHDLRQSLGIVFSAEAVLRRRGQIAPEDEEILNMVRDASKRAVGLLTEFAIPMDGEITLPIGGYSTDSK
jgi:signal transduction histidine kinase